jgi:tetratricopeptide (TPR) repeat protein
MVRPAQLPPNLSAFVGRRAELKRAAALIPGRDVDARTSAISAISGMAGIGKTTLAIHWAHQIADQYPDGQLFVNLRGYATEASAISPSEALTRFLRALGLEKDQIPQDVEAQSAAFRSLLADRRVLVVLDNAQDSEQVLPLLPAGAGCLTIVTSRNRLTGLVTSVGAYSIGLNVLPPLDARELLERRIGAARIRNEPAAVDVLVQRCGGLPLALAIIGGRAAGYPELTLRSIADDLRPDQPNLDAFADDDILEDPRAVFSWSYRTLSAPAARLFRLIGTTLTGPHLTLVATANLAGVTAHEIRPVLAELVRSNLLNQPEPSRFSIHDLLGSYGAELSRNLDTEQQRHEARHRLLQYYLRACTEANSVLFQSRKDSSTPSTVSLTAAVDMPTERDAVQAWLNGEILAILAAIRQASRHGFVDIAWQTCMAMSQSMHMSGQWTEWLGVLKDVQQAVEKDGTPLGRAHIAQEVGLHYAELQQPDAAEEQLNNAIALFDSLGDNVGMGATYRLLAYLFSVQGRPAEMLDSATRAQRHYLKAGHLVGQAFTLNMMGLAEGALGNVELAVECGSQALEIFRTLGHLRGAAATHDSLGTAYRHLGQFQTAVDHYEEAITMRADIGDSLYVATSLHRLGDTHHEAGDAQSAAAAWRRALDIMTAINHPHVDELRAKLAGEPEADRHRVRWA